MRKLSSEVKMTPIDTMIAVEMELSELIILHSLLNGANGNEVRRKVAEVHDEASADWIKEHYRAAALWNSVRQILKSEGVSV